MSDVNSLTLCRDDYESTEELFEAVKTAVKLLLDADYIMTIRYDEKGLGIIAIDYNHADQSYGCHYPYWLSPEEADTVYFEREATI